jgi:hypothetical protein
MSKINPLLCLIPERGRAAVDDRSPSASSCWPDDWQEFRMVPWSSSRSWLALAALVVRTLAEAVI